MKNRQNPSRYSKHADFPQIFRARPNIPTAARRDGVHNRRQTAADLVAAPHGEPPPPGQLRRSGRKGSPVRRAPFWTACLAFLCIGAFSGGPVGGTVFAATASATTASWISRLPRGEEFDNNGFRYALLPSLHGRMARMAGRTPLADGNTETESGEFVARKGLFTIRKTPTAAPGVGGVAPRADRAPLPEHPVAYNMRMQSLGVMTRNLSLALVNIDDAQSLANEYGLIFSFRSEAMRTAFYSTPAGIDLMQLRTRLMKDPRIVRVTLEIIDRTRQPR